MYLRLKDTLETRILGDEETILILEVNEAVEGRQRHGLLLMWMRDWQFW